MRKQKPTKPDPNTITVTLDKAYIRDFMSAARAVELFLNGMRIAAGTDCRMIPTTLRIEMMAERLHDAIIDSDRPQLPF